MHTVFLHDARKTVPDADIQAALAQALDGRGTLKNILILPPDITRGNAYAGPITCMLYALCKERGIEAKLLPALGSHVFMTPAEMDTMYPGIPHDRFIHHDWRNDVVSLGQIPGEFVASISEGLLDTPVDVQLNREILDPSYDLIVSVGQVVPHEVAGMANYLKNLFVGCGGSSMIGASHYLGALYGMERMMGRDGTPLHKLFDYARERFIPNLPLLFALTVTNRVEGKLNVYSVAIGTERDAFEKSVSVSLRRNFTLLDAPPKHMVVYLEPHEFRTTWLGNKAIYRTRMAIADGGKLTILAPAVHGCGEDPINDVLIKRYGYIGRDRVLEATRNDPEMQANLSVPAHLIHGSSEGRFEIIYAARELGREVVESLNFTYMDCAEAMRRYDIHSLKDGYNTVDGEEIFYISNPALGLWAWKERFS
jgi:nickel-dependent lactate racemase